MKDDPGEAQRDHWTHPTTTTKQNKTSKLNYKTKQLPQAAGPHKQKNKP